MATLIIPDETPLAELDKLARSIGKRLQCKASKGQKSQPEDIFNVCNRTLAANQPALRVVDSQRNR